MSTERDDRVHEPSVVRLQQARLEGDIPVSVELSGAIHMVGALLAGMLFFGMIATGLGNWTKEFWSVGWAETGVSRASAPEASLITSQMQSVLLMVSAILVPTLLLMLLVSILGQLSQTGIVFRPANLSPGENVSGPLRWWQKTFSLKTPLLVLLSLPKSAIAFGTAIVGFWFHREQIFALSAMPVESVVKEMQSLVLTIGLLVAGILLVLSLTDYAIQRWSYSRRMRMSDQQMRDELRMQNGDPQTSTRRRRVHRELVDRRA